MFLARPYFTETFMFAIAYLLRHLKVALGIAVGIAFVFFVHPASGAISSFVNSFLKNLILFWFKRKKLFTAR